MDGLFEVLGVDTRKVSKGSRASFVPAFVPEDMGVAGLSPETVMVVERWPRASVNGATALGRLFSDVRIIE